MSQQYHKVSKTQFLDECGFPGFNNYYWIMVQEMRWDKLTLVRLVLSLHVLIKWFVTTQYTAFKNLLSDISNFYKTNKFGLVNLKIQGNEEQMYSPIDRNTKSSTGRYG